ncbi:MAG: polysaccharide deacetylase family protein [Actinomycetota bacterium]
MRHPVPILLYHHVSDEPLPWCSTPVLFDRHLAWLADNGYRTISLDQLRDRIEGRAEGAPREVVITFDDGYAELGGDVADSLRRHGFRAAAFLITSRNPDTEGELYADGYEAPDQTAYLSWQRARELADEGLFEFHSHTHSHRTWPLIADEAPVLAAEISTARSLLSDRLERPETDFDHLAWPYGRACGPWEDEARNLGVPVQYVVQRGAVTRADQIDRLPRILVDGMPLSSFSRWVRILSRRPTAIATNKVFGAIRARRQGAAYV